MNPRAGLIQPTPLAGEPLRPLGYFSICQVVRSVCGNGNVAERVGFEPTDTCVSPVFKTGSFNRSDISPSKKGLFPEDLNIIAYRPEVCQQDSTAGQSTSVSGLRPELTRGKHSGGLDGKFLRKI